MLKDKELQEIYPNNKGQLTPETKECEKEQSRDQKYIEAQSKIKAQRTNESPLISPYYIHRGIQSSTLNSTDSTTPKWLAELIKKKQEKLE